MGDFRNSPDDFVVHLIISEVNEETEDTDDHEKRENPDPDIPFHDWVIIGR